MDSPLQPNATLCRPEPLQVWPNNQYPKHCAHSEFCAAFRFVPSKLWPNQTQPVPAADVSPACPQAGSQLTPPWSNSSLQYPDSQISSPAPSDSTVASSPTSLASPAQYRPFPRDSWQATGYTGYFPPPNTVAPSHPGLSGLPGHPGHPGHGIPEHFGGHTAIMTGFPHQGLHITGCLILSCA